MRRHVIASMIAASMGAARVEAYDPSRSVPSCTPIQRVAHRGASQIRPLDGLARHLLEHGRAVSPTFARLVAELDAADVVVYVQVELRSSVGPSGRLRFMSAAGGRRYLRVSVEPGGRSWGEVLGRRHELTAVLAHELQHAAEVAAATAVVDRAGFSELYRSIGIRLNAGMFDTVAARLTGKRVLSELRTSEGGVCLEEL